MDIDIKDFFLTKAKANLTTDGYLVPCALLFRGSECFPIPVSYTDQASKEGFFKAVGQLCKVEGYLVMVLIQDIAMRAAKTLQEASYILSNYATESPLTYPEGVIRKEGIMLMEYHVTTGKATTLIQVYHRVGGQVVYDEKIEETDDSLLGGGCLRCLREGYMDDSPIE